MEREVFVAGREIRKLNFGRRQPGFDHCPTHALSEATKSQIVSRERETAMRAEVEIDEHAASIQGLAHNFVGLGSLGGQNEFLFRSRE
jgi:hypothetical protein